MRRNSRTVLLRFERKTAQARPGEDSRSSQRKRVEKRRFFKFAFRKPGRLGRARSGASLQRG